MIHTLTNEKEWLEKRREGVGGSDAPIILNVAPKSYGSRLSLWSEKTGIGREEPDEEEFIDHLEVGRAIEKPIAQLAGRKAGREVIDPGQFTIVQSESRDFAASTPDFVVLDKKKGFGVLQVKNVGAFARSDWKEEPPEFVLVQNQHELFTCQTSNAFHKEYGEPKFGMIAALIGGNKVVWFDHDANDRFLRILLESEAEFWDRVLEKNPPDPSGSEACARVLANLYKSDNGKVIDLGEEWIPEAQEWTNLGTAIKELEGKRETMKQKIVKEIGENARATLPDGSGFSLLTTAEKYIEPKPYTRRSYRTLRRLKGK